MILDEGMKISIIREMLRMSKADFAAALGVGYQGLYGWESGKSHPTKEQREILSKLCYDNGIGFSPSGMPFPMADVVSFKRGKK